MGQDWGTVWGAGISTVTRDNLHNVLVKFAAIDTSFNIVNPADPNVSMAYRYLRHSTLPFLFPDSATVDPHPGAGYHYQDRRPVPFAVFDEENNNQRLDVGFMENNSGGVPLMANTIPLQRILVLTTAKLRASMRSYLPRTIMLRQITRLFRQIFSTTIRR